MMPVRRSQNWLPSIFNDFFDNELMAKANATAPAINVIETDKAYKLELAAPGMTKEDFSVRIDEENNLVISMEISRNSHINCSSRWVGTRHLRFGSPAIL